MGEFLYLCGSLDTKVKIDNNFFHVVSNEMLNKALRDVGAVELGQPHSKRLYVVPSIGDHTDLVRKREEEEEERERVRTERGGRKEEREGLSF